MRRTQTLALVGVFASLTLGHASLTAQEISFDPYAPIWGEGVSRAEAPSSGGLLQSLATHFLVYPFELIRWPIDETLLFVEEYHIDDKIDWIYEQMKNRGVTPKIRSLFGVDQFGGGFEIEFVKLSGLKEQFPETSLETSALWTLDSITEYRSKLAQRDIGDTSWQVEGGLTYENRGEEHFYGIGPNTSLGDGTSYRVERTTLEATLGRPFLNSWNLRANFSFQNVNITNGEDGGRGEIDRQFVATGRQRISGLGGDELLHWGLELHHDNRDDVENPTRGGYERLHFGFTKGLDSSSGFFKYRAEAAHFFPVFSEKRVAAFRGVLEHSDEVDDRDVPFFAMARLGGYGTPPRFGDTHRGFRRDRFYDESLILFNFEYRWNAWEYREWRMDPALFCDLGQVFGEWTHLQLEDFRFSYGFGFRVSYEKKVILTIDIARSHEGTEVYAKTRMPF